MNIVFEFIVAVLIVVGSGFALVGSIGLVKLGDPFSRLHAPTKASTLGVGALLAASVLHALFSGEPSLHELLILGFLFVTAPVAAHFIAKSNIHHRRAIETLPDPGEDKTWAVLAADDVAQRDEPKMPISSMSSPSSGTR